MLRDVLGKALHRIVSGSAQMTVTLLIAVIEELLDLFYGGSVCGVWPCFFLCWLRLRFSSLVFNLSRGGDLRLLRHRHIHGCGRLLHGLFTARA